jgi:hypothetical protein
MFMCYQINIIILNISVSYLFKFEILLIVKVLMDCSVLVWVNIGGELTKWFINFCFNAHSK